MDEKTRKKIMEMHKKGMTTYAIAKQLGLSQTGVKYVLDPKYREHMKQISRKRYQPKSSQPNNTIPSSDIAWLSQHRQSIEKSSRILKRAGVFFYYFALASAVSAAVVLVFTSFISGAIIGIIIVVIHIAPMVSVAIYPVSMQVSYPNHPNITITQNCTGFTTSESGYLNGQPINPQNTTECNLPQNMAPDGSNPFNCNISNKSITCSGTGYSSVIWKGTILNVSKR